MKRLILTAVITLIAFPVMSENEQWEKETWEKSYQILAEGQTLQSGVYYRESYCKRPVTSEDNLLAAGTAGWAYCGVYYNGTSGLTSLILHQNSLYVCYVGPVLKYQKGKVLDDYDTVSCRKVSETGKN